MSQELSSKLELGWISAARLAQELCPDKVCAYYENALRLSPYSETALKGLAETYRLKENFPQASEYLQRIISTNPANGEAWGALGHCQLMMDDLSQAYASYQQGILSPFLH